MVTRSLLANWQQNRGGRLPGPSSSGGGTCVETMPVRGRPPTSSGWSGSLRQRRGTTQAAARRRGSGFGGSLVCLPLVVEPGDDKWRTHSDVDVVRIIAFPTQIWLKVGPHGSRSVTLGLFGACSDGLGLFAVIRCRCPKYLTTLGHLFH
jgi:hypothetical protein